MFSSLYDRVKADKRSKEYIQGLLCNLSTIECIIVLGAEAWDFIQEMIKAGMIPDRIKIFQHSPIIHPTRLLKYGANQREAHWFYECVTDTLSYLVDGAVSKLSKEVLKDNVRKVFGNRYNNDLRGSFIYRGIYDGVTLFVTRGYEEITTLIRSYPDGSVPKSFPAFQDLVAPTTNFALHGLEIEFTWYEDFDCETAQFGVCDEAKMGEWVAHSKEERGNGYVDSWDKKQSSRKLQSATDMAGLMKRNDDDSGEKRKAPSGW